MIFKQIESGVTVIMHTLLSVKRQKEGAIVDPSPDPLCYLKR